MISSMSITPATKTQMPRGIGLTYDGMRRCQRLPELRTPLIPRDRTGLHQFACPRFWLRKSRPPAARRPLRVTRLTSGLDGNAAAGENGNRADEADGRALLSFAPPAGARRRESRSAHNLLNEGVVLLALMLQGSAAFYSLLQRVAMRSPARPGKAARSHQEEPSMTIWKTAALGAALAAAAGVGAALTPTAHGQTGVVRAQSPRALEIITGGSRIGVSVRDLEDADGPAAKGVTAGVIVEDVTAESAAEKAGIRKGDAIVEFDGERVAQRTAVDQARAGDAAGPHRAGRHCSRGSAIDRLDHAARRRRLRFRGAGRPGRISVSSATSPRPVPPRPPAAPRPPSPPSVWNFDELVGRSTNRLRDLGQHAVAAARRILRHERGRARLVGHRRLRRRQGRYQGRRRHHQRQRHGRQRSLGRPPPRDGSLRRGRVHDRGVAGQEGGDVERQGRAPRAASPVSRTIL